MRTKPRRLFTTAEAVRNGAQPPAQDAQLLCIDGRKAIILGWLYAEQHEAWLRGTRDDGMGLEEVHRVCTTEFNRIMALDLEAAKANEALRKLIVATQGVNRRAGE